ncbi:ATP-binding protein [Sulfurovum sp. bin170]|uniref:ATP-dependent nuclease n=1 Tax=Sulfurovum sp. bin170 TaxID=2695268 RepID=UPI0013DFDADC|nr:AAA family ATPase [Sulfurovum sp. bin170]NEW60686.1 ATP-binding protein [Sulfurovum sp. bin170]
MGTREDLAKKWKTPYFNQKLKSITFNEVGLRGVKNTSIKFNYPITAIAGANGIGKTTILQLIACLYHNNDTSHKPYRFSNAKNAKPYYTFRDFFIHFRGEDKSEGSAIEYAFRVGKKKKSHTLKKGQQWNDYNRRPERTTDFYGVSRVIPANEFAMIKNTFGSSSASFTTKALSKQSTSMIKKVLAKPLESVEVNSSTKVVNFDLNKINLSTGLSYSNFNMGAGEEVIISLISRMNELPQNSIVLIEELELGLHPKAQKLLIENLFQIVLDKKLQLIFTTHSPFLFDAVPTQGRLLLRKPSDKLEVIYSPSSSLAFSELTGETPKELTVYVEDKVAKLMLETLLSSSIRKRIYILDVGSKENLVSMIGSHYRNESLGKAIAIADGDLTEKELRVWYKSHLLKSYKGELFDEEVFQQETQKLFAKFVGDNAPEKYMLEKLKENEAYARFVDDSDVFVVFIADEICLGDHHGLFRVIGEEIGLSEESVMRDVVRGLVQFYQEGFRKIKKFIEGSLK